MSENLLIVESPSKAKTLKKYLGKTFEILASYGHVRDLVPKTGAVDTDNGFAMKYQLVERNEKHVKALTEAVKKADRIYLATDPDREGEAIAWHIAEILKSKKLLKDKPLHRVAFYEITQSAVKAAVDNPRDIAMPLVNAQQARRALDYLVGFNLSPLLWKKIRRGLSAGRVQSPALRLIVEREDEILAFKSEEYWSIHFDSHKGAQNFTAKLTQFKGEKLTQFSVTNDAQQKEITEFLAKNAKGSASVVNIEKKRKTRSPAPPFTTSTLQQEAVRKLGFSTDRAMKIAQQLYEGVNIGSGPVGLISYMRTDSFVLSNEALNDIRSFVTKNFDADYLPSGPVFYKNASKNAQEAHEAIRPTSIDRTPQSLKEFLTPEQFRLYEMIWKRTVACQMSPAKFDTVAVDFAVGGEKNLFRATGQTMVFPGFIAVYLEDEDDREADGESKLPVLDKGDVVPIDKLYGDQHFTQPPPRYTEATIVKTLEEHGIGRPSTYSSIISTLIAREYVILDKKRFQPTDVGKIVSKFLVEHFTRYVDYDFTAKLEDKLDDISNGKLEWIPVLEEFWGDFNRTIEEKGNVSRAEITHEALDEACPKCGKGLSIRLGKRGRFIGCAGYPECDYTRNLDGPDGAPAQTGPVEIGVTDAGIKVLLMNGPYGPYVQLGEAAEEGKKPKRASLPKGMLPAQVTMEIADKLLSLPRELGMHPESGKKIIVNNGRFGPYIQHEKEYRSIPKSDDIFTINLARALEIMAQPKSAGRAGATPLKVLGEHPDDQQNVSVFSGQYGPYVKHGKVNATIPSELTPDTITLEQAINLLEAKAAKPGKGKRSSKAPAKKTAPKAVAKKPAAEKPAIKKTAVTKLKKAA